MNVNYIWPYLSQDDLNELEKTKSRFLKIVLSLKKTISSRFTYELVETDLYENDLNHKYNLPDTAAYDDFMEQQIVNFSQINSKFFETPVFHDYLIGKMLILRIDTCLLDMLVMAFTTSGL
jgi:hypothetical protein